MPITDIASVPVLEQTTDNSYQRHLRTERGLWHAYGSDSSELMSVVATVRRMFDLDAQPDEIRESLQRDSTCLLHCRRKPPAWASKSVLKRRGD